MLLPGDPAPTFRCTSSVNPQFHFDTAAGRYIVLSFFGSLQYGPAERFLTEIVKRGDRFDIANAMFFGVTTDPEDVQRIQHQDPRRIYFYDLDGAVSRLYGVIEPRAGGPAEAGVYRACTFILDQALRVVAVIGMGEDVAAQVDAVFSTLDALPPLAALPVPPPVLVVPYVLEPELCQTLIDYYESRGGEDSGFMRDVDGKTVGILDYAHKRRMDCEITDQPLIRTLHARLLRRVVPAIRQAYQFNVTRIERHIVACYDAEQGAHFRAHRDNTTLGTAHRRFAVTINLNSPDYEGGEIWFPEFSPQRYKAASGAAIVFSCSLLHEVPKVTRGRRYAFLPFLYDDAAAAVRERNRKYLGNIDGARGEGRGSGGGGPAVAVDCNAAPAKGRTAPASVATAAAAVVVDGSCGCGNPNGCGTCLTAPTYPLVTAPAATRDAGA